jgi:hypothetical protein
MRIPKKADLDTYLALDKSVQQDKLTPPEIMMVFAAAPGMPNSINTNVGGVAQAKANWRDYLENHTDKHQRVKPQNFSELYELGSNLSGGQPAVDWMVQDFHTMAEINPTVANSFAKGGQRILFTADSNIMGSVGICSHYFVIKGLMYDISYPIELPDYKPYIALPFTDNVLVHEMGHGFDKYLEHTNAPVFETLVTLDRNNPKTSAIDKSKERGLADQLWMIMVTRHNSTYTDNSRSSLSEQFAICSEYFFGHKEAQPERSPMLAAYFNDVVLLSLKIIASDLPKAQKLEGLRMLKETIHEPPEKYFGADGADIFAKMKERQRYRADMFLGRSNEPFFAADETLLGTLNAAAHAARYDDTPHVRALKDREAAKAYDAVEKVLVDGFAAVRRDVMEKIGLELTREQESCHLKFGAIKR